MADQLGISLTAYNNKETGKSDFRLPEMFIIANFLRMPMEEIFTDPKGGKKDG